MITHNQNTPYHPQANRTSEAQNKILGTTLTKMCNANRTYFDIKIPTILRAYQTTYKRATSNSPFELIYGLEATHLLILLLITSKWQSHSSLQKTALSKNDLSD